MHPTYHPRSCRFLICRTVVTAIAMIGLTGGCAFNSAGARGQGSTAVVVSRTRPAELAAPNGPVTVVPGKQVIGGVELGFPHTMAGAISAAATVESEVVTLNASHAATVGRLIADSSNTTLPQDAAQGVSDIRHVVGAPVTGPVPAGYSVHMTAVEYQLRDINSDKVTVILLCELTWTQPRLGTQDRIGVFPLFMHWEHGDWKEAGDAGPVYMKLIAEPYSAKAAALGWKKLLY